MNPFAHADSLEGMLMPGNVITGHAKLETDAANATLSSIKPGSPSCAWTATRKLRQTSSRKPAFMAGLKRTIAVWPHRAQGPQGQYFLRR